MQRKSVQGMYRLYAWGDALLWQQIPTLEEGTDREEQEATVVGTCKERLLKRFLQFRRFVKDLCNDG